MIKGKNAQIVELITRLEQSDNQKHEFECQFQKENVKLTDVSAKFNELQIQMDQKSDELATLKLNQNQSETNVDFAQKEQKILVQELEAKLAQMGKENEELSKKMEAGEFESNDAQCLQIKELERQVKELNVKMSKTIDELNAKDARLKESEKLELQLKALNEANVRILLKSSNQR